MTERAERLRSRVVERAEAVAAQAHGGVQVERRGLRVSAWVAACMVTTLPLWVAADSRRDQSFDRGAAMTGQALWEGLRQKLWSDG